MPENKEVRKLELCDIAPYLPYRLKTDKGLLHALCNDGLAKCKMNDGEIVKGEISDLKPLLHPLSMLTQEITHNGGKVNLGEIIFPSNDYKTEFERNCDIEALYMSAAIGFSCTYYEVVKTLLKYHFDINNLIPSGLAIPIHNTK